MRTFFILGTFFTTALFVANCGSDSLTCDDTHTCASSGDGSSPVDGGGDVVQPPQGCEPSAEPKDAPKCVVDGYGVFVDATNGQDANAGTMESPVKTIMGGIAKLAGKNRVYVCAGTYAEHVKLTSAVSLYGGFVCGTWTYDTSGGSIPKVLPNDVGYALEVADVPDTVTIEDLSFQGLDATNDGDSSIAAFAHGAGSVALSRVEISAGNGKSGAQGAAGGTAAITTVSNGAKTADANQAVGTVAGAQKICTCSGGATSTGGGGGAPGAGGGPGAPVLSADLTMNGAGGLASTLCNAAAPNGSGANGADATPAASGVAATSLGGLSATGWLPSPGGAGKDGSPGGGGGGGAGSGANAASSGACGGCGGTGGGAGGGGGASIALLSLDSSVTAHASVLSAKVAGQGGNGGAIGSGAQGGNQAPTGLCPGGAGGKGGDGGSGAGGAGGVSAAILYKGTTAPINDGSTLTAGMAGAKGTGGTSGMNDGLPGMSMPIVAIQ